MSTTAHNLAGSKPPLWFLLLAHHSYNRISHTLQIPIGSRQVCLCTRCTGILLGMLAGLFYAATLASALARTPLLIFLFPLPAVADWLLQVFRVSESTSLRRLATGALVGQAYLVLLVALAGGWLGLLWYFALAFAAYAVFLYVLFWKTGIMGSYMGSAWPLG